MDSFRSVSPAPLAPRAPRLAPAQRTPRRRRHPGGGRHRPHRPALAGHDPVDLRPAGPGSEGSLPSRRRRPTRHATWRPTTGAPKPSSARSSPCSRPGWPTRSWSRRSAALGRAWRGPARGGRTWDLGPPKEIPPHPGGGDAEDAPGRRQLPADRRRLRVFPQHCAADVAEVAPNRWRPRMGIFGDVSGTDQTITFSRGSGFYHRTTCRWVNLNFDKAHWTVTNDVMEAVLAGKGPMAGPAYHRRPIETR